MKVYTLLLCFIILALPEMWTFIPYSPVEIHPFIFKPNIGITLVTWIWFACINITYIIFAHVLCISLPEYRKEMRIFFFLTVGHLIDYMLCYNGRFEIWIVPICYSTFMLLVFFIVFLKSVLKWKIS